MDSVIFHPLEEYEQKFKDLHQANTEHFFETLVQQSGINIEENRETVKQYGEYRENIAKLKRKLFWLRALRVLLCLLIVTIPLVIWKLTPSIKTLRSEIEQADQKAEELFAEAKRQMRPLNRLFTDRDALNLIQETIPLLSFAPNFSVQQEKDMQVNYDYCGQSNLEQSALDVLAGHYNDNPFVFENRLLHRMGVATYYGQRTISYTETYRDSNGKLRTRVRTETLRASVTKPKPFYSTQVILHYGSQAGPELSFSRDASHLEQKSEKALARHVKQGAKKLKRKDDKAIRNNEGFTSMSNAEFEVLFDALNRTHEVQYRTLFTPLAQTNMVALILSKSGYGDDFAFIKENRMNEIVSNHSQGRLMNLPAGAYTSHSFDEIRESFLTKNAEFFKAVYFDFAPIWAIPAYQERPVHSLKPLPDYQELYSQKECEVLLNAVDSSLVVHPQTKTRAILKTAFVGSKDQVDKTCVTAYSYDILPQVDIVSVRAGDGHYYNVSVPWDQYIPLENSRNFFVTKSDLAQEDDNVVASKNGLCVFQ